MKEAEELVDKNTRKKLNKIAEEEGIKDPKSFPNKLSIAKEIVKVRKARKYAKKPIGLYIED